MRVTSALWFYFVSKAVEFMDTIFMVIRKRFTQITFLHVFHHSTMLIIWWIVMTWIPVRAHSPVLSSVTVRAHLGWASVVRSRVEFHCARVHVRVLRTVGLSIASRQTLVETIYHHVSTGKSTCIRSRSRPRELLSIQIQFILIFTHTLNGLVRGCDYPLWSELFSPFFSLVNAALPVLGVN